MFSLTSHERKVLLLIGILILCGAVLKFFNISFTRQKPITEINPPVSNNTLSPDISAKQAIINVNTATQGELEKLPGIGPEIAQRIIEYREAKGQFIMLDDLNRVKGIGKKKLEAIKDYVVF